jgi:hypothetical protein
MVRGSQVAVTTLDYGHESLCRYGKWFTVTNVYTHPVTGQVHSETRVTTPEFNIHIRYLHRQMLYLVQQ